MREEEPDEMTLSLSDAFPEDKRDEAKTMELFKEEGRVEGWMKGTVQLSALISKLIALGRNDDIARVVSDPEYRDKLYAEFGMAEM